MCLGIPGQVVALPADEPMLAHVDVAGVTRPINIAILEEGSVQPGDWILIHAGVAMEIIDAERAKNQLAVLQEYTGSD
jgi:hydrogenase assembly chaperone HypC/HupF